MTLKIINQDLLEIESGILAHCCNTLGVMGGLAGELAKKYPAVYQVYKAQPVLYLGGHQLVSINSHLHIFNMITQNEIGTHKVQTNFDALRTCLIELEIWRRALGLCVYLPYMLGSGLAGGSTQEQKAATWKTVSGIILETCPDAVICRKP